MSIKKQQLFEMKVSFYVTYLNCSTFLNVCPFDCIAITRSGINGPVEKVNHTSSVPVVTPTDRPKSVHNRCVFEHFGKIIVLSLNYFNFQLV